MKQRIEAVHQILACKSKALQASLEAEKAWQDTQTLFEAYKGEVYSYGAYGATEAYKNLEIKASDFVSSMNEAVEYYKEKNRQYGREREGTAEKKALEEELIALDEELSNRLHWYDRHIGEIRSEVCKLYEWRIEKLLEEARNRHQAALKKSTVPQKKRKAGATIPVITNDIKMAPFGEAISLPVGHWDTAHEAALVKRQEEDRFAELDRLCHDLIAGVRDSDTLELSLEENDAEHNLLLFAEKYAHNERQDERVLIEFLEATILRFISSCPRTTKRVCCIQSRMANELFSFLGALQHEDFSEMIMSEEANGGFHRPNAALELLVSEMESLNILLKTSGHSTIHEYNKENYENGIWKQETLLIIKDYPLGFDDAAIERLKTVLGQAKAMGIHVIMTVCRDLLESDREKGNAGRHETVFDFFSNRFTVSNRYQWESDFSFEKLQLPEKVWSEDFSLNLYAGRLLKYIQTTYDPAIPSDFVFQKLNITKEKDADRRREFSKVLRIPVGMEGTKPAEIALDSGSSPHVVITGTTGTGKSVLLHDIIIGTICNYRSDEVELYLFDFKDNPEGFSIYVKHNIPHVKKVANRNKPREISALLSMIQQRYRANMEQVELVGDESIRNIAKYNKALAEGKLPQRLVNGKPHEWKKIPRIMVVIDEFQKIEDQASLDILADIAKQGRVYGVILVMASQKCESRFGATVDQFNHRFEFKNQDLGNLIPLCVRRKFELVGPKGLCFYASDGNTTISPALIRAAFNKDNKLLEYAATHMQAGEHDKVFLVGSVTDELKRPVDYDTKKQTFLTLEETRARYRDRVTVYRDELVGEAKWLQTAPMLYRAESLDSRGISLLLGVDSVSLEPFEYRLNRSNPSLILYGSYSRSVNMLYSVVKSALIASEGVPRPRVYYVEGGQPDAAIAQLKAARPEGLRFVSTPAELDEMLRELEAVGREREDGRGSATPILVIFAAYREFVKQLEKSLDTPEKAKPTARAALGGGGRSSSIFATQFRAATENAAQSEGERAAEQAREAENAVKLARVERVKKLLAGGKEHEIYFVAVFHEKSDWTETAEFHSFRNVSSMVYVPQFEEGESAAGSSIRARRQILEFAKALFPNFSDKLLRDGIESRCCYQIMQEDIQEVIPYEYLKDKESASHEN